MLATLNRIAAEVLWIEGWRSFDPVYLLRADGLHLAAYMPYHSELGQLSLGTKEHRRIRRALQRNCLRRMHRLVQRGIDDLYAKCCIVREGGQAGQQYWYYLSLYTPPFDPERLCREGCQPQDFGWGSSLRDIARHMVRLSFQLTRPRPPIPWEEMEAAVLAKWYQRCLKAREGAFMEERPGL